METIKLENKTEKDPYQKKWKKVNPKIPLKPLPPSSKHLQKILYQICLFFLRVLESK